MRAHFSEKIKMRAKSISALLLSDCYTALWFDERNLLQSLFEHFISGTQIPFTKDLIKNLLESILKCVQDLSGEGHISVQIDVASSESVTRAAAEIKSKMPGRVPDIVVNSAGITRDAYMLKMTEENYDAVLDVNLKGTWNVCKTFSQMMVDAKVK